MAIVEGPITHNSNIGEGRKSHSRSSSQDSGSSESPKQRNAPLSPDSGDEADAAALNINNASSKNEAETPLVRPPVVNAWGTSAFGGFLQRNTSSPFQSKPSLSGPASHAESQTGPDDESEFTSEPGPSYPSGQVVPADSASSTSAQRKASIPSLLISSASSSKVSHVPPSLRDSPSPQSMSSNHPLTPESASSTHPASASSLPPPPFLPLTAPKRSAPPSPPPSDQASKDSPVSTSSAAPAHTGAPARGRGAKRGTKPGAKRGEWRVKNYTANNARPGEDGQPPDTSTFSSSFKIVPPTAPLPGILGQNGYSVASSSALRLPDAGNNGSQGRPRSSSSRHSSDGDDFIMSFEAPASPQPAPESFTPLGNPSEQGPAPRLVAIVIDDKRYGSVEKQLVEVTVPVRQSSDGGLWVEADNVCQSLQGGPSRIDGPAKVYTYRGKYRQYFLRVSIDNRDTFGPANLTINAKRVLNVYVEPDVPPRTVVIENPDPNSATSPLPSTSQTSSSPALAEHPEDTPAMAEFRVKTKAFLKRAYDNAMAHSAKYKAEQGQSSSSKKPRKQQKQQQSEGGDAGEGSNG